MICSINLCLMSFSGMISSDSRTFSTHSLALSINFRSSHGHNNICLFLNVFGAMSDVKKYTVGTINNADPKKYEILVRIFDESVLEAANLNAKKYGIHNGV